MMNQKVYSVFLFFLYSNCVNGVDVIPSSAYTTPSTPAASESTDPADVSTQEGTLSKGDEVDNKEGFIIVGNPHSNLVAYFNLPKDAAILIDLNNNLIALGNGKDPSEVVIDVDHGNGVYVHDPNPSKVKEETERQYLLSFKNGLKPLLTQDHAIKFRLDDVPPEILKAINEIINGLVDDISEVLEKNPKVGLEVFLAAGSELLRLQELEGFVQVLGIKGVSIRGDLARSTNIIKGLIALYGRVPGGFPALIDAGAVIRFQKIANDRNGLETLAEVIREISVLNDVGDLLGDILNDQESLLKLIRLLGGNSSNGVNGVLKVVAAVAVFANGESSLEYIINVIIQFLALNGENENNPQEISSELKDSISKVLDAINDARCSGTLSGAVEVLRSLEKGHLIINKINISSLISKLISTINKPKELRIIVDILIDLREVIDIEESLPRLLLVLILNLNSPLGIRLLEGVGVSTDIDRNGISGGIIEEILKSVADITSRLLQDLYEGLCSVAALEKIINSINKAISQCGFHKDLKALLGANEAVEDLIKAILQVLGGLKLKVPEDTCSRVLKTVDTCSSLNFYVSIEVNVTISG